MQCGEPSRQFAEGSSAGAYGALLGVPKLESAPRGNVRTNAAALWPGRRVGVVVSLGTGSVARMSAPTSSEVLPEGDAALCVVAVMFGGDSTCTLCLPGTSDGIHVRTALARIAGLELEQLAPLTFVMLRAGPTRRWKRRRMSIEWNDVWNEVEPLHNLQHSRRGAAIVLRLCKLRDAWLVQAAADELELQPASLTSIDFSEARERFVRGDYPFRSMDDVIGLGAGIMRLLHGAHDCAIHTPRLVLSLLSHLVPPAHLRPEPSMDQLAIAEAVLERHRLQEMESPPLSPHQLRLAWLEHLMRALCTLDCGETLTGSRIFSGIRLLNRDAPALRATARLLVSTAGLALLDRSLRVVVRIPWDRVEAWKQVGHRLDVKVLSHQKPLRLHTPCAWEISVLLPSAQQATAHQMHRHTVSPGASECESRRCPRSSAMRPSGLISRIPEGPVVQADPLPKMQSGFDERVSRWSRRSFFSRQSRSTAPPTPEKYVVQADRPSAAHIADPERRSRWSLRSILLRRNRPPAGEAVFRASTLSITAEVMEEGGAGRSSASSRWSSWSLQV